MEIFVPIFLPAALLCHISFLYSGSIPVLYAVLFYFCTMFTILPGT